MVKNKSAKTCEANVCDTDQMCWPAESHCGDVEDVEEVIALTQQQRWPWYRLILISCCDVDK